MADRTRRSRSGPRDSEPTLASPGTLVGELPDPAVPAVADPLELLARLIVRRHREEQGLPDLEPKAE